VNTRINFILPETRVIELYATVARAIVWVYLILFYAFIFENQEKMFNCSR